MIAKAICSSIFVLMATQVFAGDPTLKTQRDRSSYAFGANLIGNIKQQGIELDMDLVMKGMKDAMSGGKLLMNDEETRKSISFYQNDVRNKQAALRTTAAAQNSKAGAAYLAGNALKEGVVTLPSGLQYTVLKAGDGNRATDADTVEFHYRSTSIKGTELESSYLAGKPARRKLKGGVVPGLSEALKLMPVGSKWQLFIPSQLAYGERGNGSSVGPNETVLFEVELIAISKGNT